MKNRGSKTYAYFSPLVGSVGHHLMILKVAGKEEVVSMSNVPIILKFSTRRAEALNVKELVRQTGIVVTLSRDNENCYAEAGTTKTGETSSTCTSATDDQGVDLGDNNLLDY